MLLCNHSCLKGEQVVATKQAWYNIEAKHFMNIAKYAPGIFNLKQSGVKIAIKLGLYQVSTCFEHVVALMGNYKVVSKDTHDLSDGSDCKLSTARHNGRPGHDQYRAPIDVTNKKGKIRAQVYNDKLDCFFYFVIPRKIRKNISTIQIPFNLDGTPMKTNKWWKYEQKTFIDMCKA